MGNNTSSEASHKPHKLTKPKVGNLATPIGVSASGIHSAPENGRFSNSYSVGSSMPISPTKSSPAGLAPIDAGPSIAKRFPRPMAAATRRHSNCRSNVSDTQSTQIRRPVRRSHIITSNTVIRSPVEIHSPTAQVFASKGFARPELGIESFKTSNQGVEQWKAVNYSLDQTHAQQLIANQGTPEASIARSESMRTSSGVTENTWKSSHPHTEPASPITRSNSEVSLYTPMRRRSMIQTPGVATRAQQTAIQISDTPNFRNSLPSTPCLSKSPSRESLVTRRTTMPAAPIDMGSFKMSVDTPSEADYRQLGGIKFGSLRITNGAPDLTPLPQEDGKSKSDKDPDYFECKQSFSESYNSELSQDAHNGKSQTAPASRGERATEQDAEILSFATRIRIAPCADSLRLHIVDVKATVLSPSPIQTISSTSPRPAKETRKEHSQPGEECVGRANIPATDMIGIKKDGNAGANIAKYQMELEHKTIKTLARSDSGFISSPSSDASPKALSKADSGYSSNVSLRSLRSLKPEAFDRTRKSIETQSSGTPERRASGKSGPSSASSVAPQKLHARSKSELPPPPPPPPENEVPPIPARRSSLSSFAHVAIKRIPTLKRSKSRNVASDDIATAPEAQLTEKTPSKSHFFTSTSTSKRTHSKNIDHASMKPTQTQRQEVSVNTVDVERKPRKHKKPSSSVAHRLGPRNQSSQDTLKTILSVGSTDLLQACELTQVDGAPASTIDERLQTTSRKRSLRSLSLSFTQATSNFFHSKHSDVSLPPKVPTKDRSAVDKGVLKVQVQALPKDNRQFRASQTSSIQARIVAPTDKQMNNKGLKKVHSAERKSPKQLSPLKTQRSAPNFAGQDQWPLSPTVLELSHLRKDKTTPPISMRTRTSKGLRPTPPSRSWSAPPVEVSARPQAPVVRNRSHESLASRRSSHSSNHSPHGSLSSIMEAPVSSPQLVSPIGHDHTLRHNVVKPSARPQTSTSARHNRGPNTSAPTHELLRNSRTLPGIAIPYPDVRTGHAPARHRSMSDVQSTSPTWATKQPSESQLQELRVLTQQHQQSYHHLLDRSRRHSRHSSGGSGRGQYPVSHAPQPQPHHTSPRYRGIAI